jgi:hypothetical protein
MVWRDPEGLGVDIGKWSWASGLIKVSAHEAVKNNQISPWLSPDSVS